MKKNYQKTIFIIKLLLWFIFLGVCIYLFGKDGFISYILGSSFSICNKCFLSESENNCKL